MTFDELFALSPAGTGWTAQAAPRTDEARLFGGLLVGQAIVAASAGTRRCHALHAFFIGVGIMQQPFEIDVEPTRDGGSFATRRVEVRQGGRLLLAGHSSHHDGDDGPQRQARMPQVPPPEGLEERSVSRARAATAAGKPVQRYLADELLDTRPIELPADDAAGGETRRAIWFRPRSPVQGGQDVHQAAIGFASDVGLIHVGLLAHRSGGGGPLQAASLDHSIWFHREARVNDWMLHVQHNATVAHGRGLSHATVFSRDGTLVASVAQEFLARTSRAAGQS